MNRVFILVYAIGMFSMGVADGAPKKMSLNGRINDLADLVTQNLTENPLVKGQKLALGQFDGEGSSARNSNFGVELQRRLGELLANFRDDNSDYTLAGNYVYAEGAGDNLGLKIVRLVVTIKQLGKVLVTIPDIEVNETDDIDRVLGLNKAKPEGELKDRNESTQRAVEKPEFDLVGGHRVAAKGAPEFSMGILKKSSFNGKATPVVPESVKGLAFTNVGVGEYYDIEIANNDKADAIASITVDGLDVTTSFTSDLGPDGKKARYPGFLVLKGTTVVIKGWLHTVDQSKRDNVFSFVVNKLGQGAATQLNTRGAVGVITAQFRESCRPNGSLSRSFGGETGKGAPLDQQFKLEPVKIGDRVLSTVSIRYNRPQ
ncbi:hypothetical protein [Schlesneria paludicola]|uniref:hypothetical protein n=1 Tax=Schlesneria paludicola TaxID=360056 RepID=UPI000299FDE3|nr:hypothetical protein [Schlesneria paludicola]